MNDTLNIEQFRGGYPGLIKSLSGFMTDCAIFCLYSQGHSTGVILKLTAKGGNEHSFELTWASEITSDLVRSMNDEERTTDYGSMALAIMYVLKLTDYRHFTTSSKGTGIDFWLYKEESDSLDFGAADARLEVSGIRSESQTNSLKQRLKIKTEQVKRSDATNVPALIALTEFSVPKAIFQ